MKLKNFLFYFIVFCCFHAPLYAFYDPLSVPNNKYGIHVADVNDIADTAPLVNSNGGDWGYVTVVIQDGDRNVGKWQEIFNRMRRLHLIPIVRLATHPEGDSWKIPSKEDADRWASFLASLNWPTENRYIILFNEPNHSKEWGNTINPEEYGEIGLLYAKALKEKSSDFFILQGGFDASASTDGEALEMGEYIKRLYAAKPEFFTVIDGWTSHSYPNPAFSGPPWGNGRGTIRSFDWELAFLRSLGITKIYPIFITETGWTHTNGMSQRNAQLTPETVAQNFTMAANSVWQDKRIVAITPFVFSYQGAPFDNFSWKKLGVQEFNNQYFAYQKIPKIQGKPQQKELFETKEPIIPSQLVTNSTYTITGEIRNIGQGILDQTGTYTLIIQGLPEGFQYLPDPLPILEPQEKGIITIHIKTPSQEGSYDIQLVLRHNTKDIVIEKKTLQIIPPPNISLHMNLGWKKESSAKNITILIYDHADQLLHKFPDVSMTHGEISVTGLYNMIPGKSYRIVTLVPYYLPRQTLMTLEGTTTTVSLKRLIPLDFDGDGAMTLKDLWALLTTKPHDVLSRFF